MKKLVFVFSILIPMLLFGSGVTVESLELARQQIELFKKEFKIEPREVVFSVTVGSEEGKLAIFGEVSNLELKLSLLERLRASLGVSLEDKIKLLPDESVGEKNYAIVNVDVVNLMDAPRRTLQKNAVTQARMGDILKLFKKDGDWYLVQMEDSYIGWIDGSKIVPMNENELENYLSSSFALVVSKFAQLYKEADPASAIEAKLVQGTTLPCVEVKDEWLKLRLPDRRELFVRTSEVQLFESRNKVFAIEKDAEYIIELAKQHLGLPYLWAGTTSYGFDCSGFTQFCFKMAGYFLRRDADMQYEQGEPVLDRKELKPGDLVFFQTYKAGPSHVGIYIGNMKYIHSGSKGVAINSFDPNDPDYSADLDRKYIGARRIIQR
ncbi:MAG: NLP/P60 protein [Thermotoga sp. 50_1627]|nr:MAG: NLP/P60 protein [Thermotoga sp. 50_64]KUK24052.1 MAG: NLP/P60 protein [Thermotoga sp. 50_1627]MDK2924117.1 gamma-D-glutamyl-L-lysine dipeptidyl-peptidase [Pseudothermotoga sp.]